MKEGYYSTLANKTMKIWEKLMELDRLEDMSLEQEKALEIVNLYEKNLIDLRSHLVFLYKNSKEAYKNAPVEVNYKEDGTVIIRLPRLLPRLKKTGAEPYMTHLLYYAIEDAIPKDILYKKKDMSKKALIYRHYYSDDNCVQDYDNNDTKTIQDILTTFFLYDDSPEYIEVHHISRKVDETYTEIILTDVKNTEKYLF